MPSKIERCAIYIRVSTAEQMMHGKSLEAQKQYLTNYNVCVICIYLSGRMEKWGGRLE